MSATRIVGIMLVRDEDLYVERAIRNVAGFCDELIFVDHRSRDETPRILARLAGELQIPAQLHRARHPSLSHDLVAALAGEDVWIFGVDGDELYDPGGLAAFRPRLLAGEFGHVFQIRGHVLHCTALDVAAGAASGYLSPPSASITKLYNFGIVESWGGYHAERLHGADGLRFKPGHDGSRYRLHEVGTWDESPFRCLHLCFLRRSSRERRALGTGRESPTDLYGIPRRLPLRLLRLTRAKLGVRVASDYKREHYRAGELVTVSTASFL